MVSQSGLPNIRAMRREKFRCYYKGRNTRLDGGDRVPPGAWGAEQTKRFYEGWDDADAQEREVEAMLEALG